MADVIPLDEFERKTQREHARVVQALRELADQVETLSAFKLAGRCSRLHEPQDAEGREVESLAPDDRLFSRIERIAHHGERPGSD